MFSLPLPRRGCERNEELGSSARLQSPTEALGRSCNRRGFQQRQIRRGNGMPRVCPASMWTRGSLPDPVGRFSPDDTVVPGSVTIPCVSAENVKLKQPPWLILSTAWHGLIFKLIDG